MSDLERDGRIVSTRPTSITGYQGDKATADAIWRTLEGFQVEEISPAALLAHADPEEGLDIDEGDRPQLVFDEEVPGLLKTGRERSEFNKDAGASVVQLYRGATNLSPWELKRQGGTSPEVLVRHNSQQGDDALEVKFKYVRVNGIVCLKHTESEWKLKTDDGEPGVIRQSDLREIGPTGVVCSHEIARHGFILARAEMLRTGPDERCTKVIVTYFDDDENIGAVVREEIWEIVPRGDGLDDDVQVTKVTFNDRGETTSNTVEILSRRIKVDQSLYDFQPFPQNLETPSRKIEVLPPAR